jgi:hypothetical protein
MQAQAYEGYFENGRFFVAGRSIPIPEKRRVFLAILEVQDDTMKEQLAAMDEFINAIGASDEDVPEFERLKLRKPYILGAQEERQAY